MDLACKNEILYLICVLQYLSIPCLLTMYMQFYPENDWEKSNLQHVINIIKVK